MLNTVLSARYSTIVCLYILLVAIPPPWAYPGGAWSPNYINSMCPPFYQFYKKVVLRLSEHGDVIETQTIRIIPSGKSRISFLPERSSIYQYRPEISAVIVKK